MLSIRSRPVPQALLSLTVALLYTATALTPVLADDALDAARQTINETNDTLRQGQRTINALDTQTEDLEAIYQDRMAEIESYQVYNQQLRDIVRSQEEELASLIEQQEALVKTSREVMPLMARMIDGLGRFIDTDLPFLLEERLARVESLRLAMASANLSVAEKYRKITEAYQIEIDYGTSLEAYEDERDGKRVEIVKIGRTALLSQSTDGRAAAYWDHRAEQWQSIDDPRVRRSVNSALKLAKRQQAPEILLLPVMQAESN